jgi:hypothetical protein
VEITGTRVPVPSGFAGPECVLCSGWSQVAVPLLTCGRVYRVPRATRLGEAQVSPHRRILPAAPYPLARERMDGANQRRGEVAAAVTA